MDIPFQHLHRNLLNNLPERIRNVIERRFGLEEKTRETLESIGKSYGVCRERIRQIEKAGLSFIKKEIQKPAYKKIFRYFVQHFRKHGNLKREDLLLSQFPSPQLQNQALFWLALGEPFLRFPETDDLYPLWTIDAKSVDLAKEIIGSFITKLEEERRPLSSKEISQIFKKDFGNLKTISSAALLSYLEISKEIEQNYEGLFGLKKWPEIYPKGIKDKAYIVLKKTGRPLHFTVVAEKINELNLNSRKPALPQTVHNELIRDSRFVLVGRGIYALREWGYIPGQVKDIIVEILKQEKRPLSKNEIVEKVLSQRLVKENTILLNLQNKEYFLKDSQGRYILREA
ncbi:hypothetical protein J7K24_02605 [bacterium]|nr:hypothetical protein [bacterium]